MKLSALKVTYDLGRKYQKPVVGGSDTHQAVQYGCIRNLFEEEFLTVETLYQAMLRGEYSIEVAPEAGFQVKTAALLKRSLCVSGNGAGVPFHDCCNSNGRCAGSSFVRQTWSRGGKDSFADT